MSDLSILIPARNEEFLARTVQECLDKIEGDTEIIVVLDGEWACPPLPVDERVTVVYNPVSFGQRAATNQAARLARGKWVMKLDAHCSLDQGFDVKLLDGAEDDWTIVPTMFNLHAFDWLCPNGHRRYQSPSGPCRDCGEPTEREFVWTKDAMSTRERGSPETTAMRFDPDLKFQYWSAYKDRQPDEPFVETMSLIGACFCLTRERYFALNICDESAFSSWGQQGTEVACKTWLSGGRLVCCRRTWFAHLFRTQGGDFGFPYPQSQSAIDRNRETSRELFIGDTWPGAVRPFQWIIDHFAPIPDWTPDTGKEIVYYTDNRLPVRLAKQAQRQIEKAGLPIVSVSMKPMGFGRNVHLPGERGVLQMFKQILAGIEATDAEAVFLCEHDVLYHPTHFDFAPPRDDVFYYNTNCWKCFSDGMATRTDDCRQVSGLCASRDLLVHHYRERVRRVELDGFSRRIGFEPGTHRRAERVDDHGSDRWESAFPNLDVRHGGNLTRSKRTSADFRDQRFAAGWVELPIKEIPGWNGLVLFAEQVSA